MSDSRSSTADKEGSTLERTLEDIEYTGRKPGRRLAVVISVVAAAWSLWQLWMASPLPFMLDFGIIVDVPARGMHLAFGLGLCFLMYPASRRMAAEPIPLTDILLAVVGAGCASYLFFGYEGLVARQGILLTYDVSLMGLDFVFPAEAFLGGIGMLVLLEAVRRSLGWPLVVVASLFLFYSIFGQSMPHVISHKGVSLDRLIGYQWLGGEAIFGIPIDVSTDFVFLFVLFGALLDRAGAGRYFLDLAFAMVGQFRGGPAKAAILASGMTGLISGSSIANTVTTGTFTIPVMRRMGMPAVKAGAIEVAASVNGQIMPPIMGAAAFVIAEFLGISYFDVIFHAMLPAFIAYLALLYISHLEALKLDLKGLPKNEIPQLGPTFVRGLHYLVPLFVLIYLLIVERWSASASIFYAIVTMMLVMLAQRVMRAVLGGENTLAQGVVGGFADIAAGLVAGARNMVSIAVAVAAAGIIVGAVSSTGLSNAMVGVAEAISGGNVYILLGLTAVVCLILGLGLPTTANYLVVASLMAPVVVEIGSAAGLVLPLIAVHLYVFYFGLMADVTPPVGLAAYAASAISRADPIRTGVQAFLYEIRTAILPLVFIFNPELLLIGVESVWQGIMIFVVSLIAILCFSSITQRWMLVRLKLYEMALLAVVTLALFRPDFFMDQVYPAFRNVPMERFAAGEMSVEPGRQVRFHIVRETLYGDRFKLFVLERPEPDENAKSFGPDFGPFDLQIEPYDEDRYIVSDLEFRGRAKEIGIQMGDYVTAIDVEQPDRPPKELVYLPALALLGLVLAMQWLRWRQLGVGRAVPDVASE